MYDLYKGSNRSLAFREQRRGGVNTLFFQFPSSGNYRMMWYSSADEMKTHEGIGEFGFRVETPEEIPEEPPGGAAVFLPEIEALKPGAKVEIRVSPGKWKYIALITGNAWQYLRTDEGGGYVTGAVLNRGAYYLAASETESGFYETLAGFTVK
jgi:hypothetical protein